MTERQLTFDSSGHTLHNSQCFSQDGGWLVFDSRNEGDKIASTRRISKVGIGTGEIVPVFSSKEGHGVAAATFSPVEDRILFIHGLIPYSFSRRTGLCVSQSVGERMDARCVREPFVPGALRGGTHAHHWSPDGHWISFTYNDEIMAARGCDLRTVGVMAPFGPVQVPDEDHENFGGRCFTFVAAVVTPNPQPGSDEIDRAFDECWVPAGSSRRLAFQGNVRSPNGLTITEMFLLDLPDDPTQASPGCPIEGASDQFPCPPSGTRQSRLTKSKRGLSSLRHWLRTSPDGTVVYGLIDDVFGQPQVHAVSTSDGSIHQVSNLPGGVQAPFNISPDGRCIACGADNSVWIIEISSGKSDRLTAHADRSIENTVCWSPDGKTLAYNRYVSTDEGTFLQIFTLH